MSWFKVSGFGKIMRRDNMSKEELWKEPERKKITTKEVLYGLIEAPINVLLCLGERRPYSVLASDFYTNERFSCEELSQKIYRMKKQN